MYDMSSDLKETAKSNMVGRKKYIDCKSLIVGCIKLSNDRKKIWFCVIKL